MAHYYSKGFLVALFGVIITLLWIGIFKFTPTEAEAIRPLVESHPLMSWLFNIFSVQAVSNLIGIAEILIAIGLVIGLWLPRVGLISGIGAIATFIITISFLLTLPSVWKVVDGMLITEFFFIKDIVFLGVAWHYLSQTMLRIQKEAVLDN